MITPNVSNFCPEPVNAEGPIKINTPLKPRTKPRIDCQLGLLPPERKDSNNTNQNGDVEIINAAMPEGIVRSPRATNPLPPSNKNVPTMAVAFQVPLVGMGSP